MRRRAWPATLAVGLLALAVEVGGAVGAGVGSRVRAALAAARFGEAEALARLSLAWDPYQIDILRARLMAFKALERWSALSDAAQQAAAWYPDGAGLWQLAGEAAFRQGRAEDAARMLWKSLWREPQSKENTAAFWAMAMRAGRSAWGDNDPRVMAAALRVVALAGGRDAPVEESMRRMMLEEAAAVFEAAGAPRSAEAARTLK
jgi:tetratricopeptide (TPR) repeat protein